MANGVHLEIYVDESDDIVHDGEFEAFGDAGDGEEVCSVGDGKPDSGCCLASNHAIA